MKTKDIYIFTTKKIIKSDFQIDDIEVNKTLVSKVEPY